MNNEFERLRRLRFQPFLRDLLQEQVLVSSDLILPLFIRDSQTPAAIATLPDVQRMTVQESVNIAEQAHALGVRAVMLFPCTPPALKNDTVSEAFNPENLLCQAVRAIRENVPDIGVITDVALDPYTTHGHDGVLDAQGNIDNDATVALLVKQAVVQAQAGASIIAPSDMMDGRVQAIRKGLDDKGFSYVAIMSYAAKFASSLYGAFRQAVGSADPLNGVDKRSYQLNPANASEAILEMQADIDEGADMVIVKPALPYLDIIQRAAALQQRPVIAYQVSGEYAMIKAAETVGAVDYQAVMLESLLCMKRAGARAIITYAALDVALRLKDKA